MKVQIFMSKFVDVFTHLKYYRKERCENSIYYSNENLYTFVNDRSLEGGMHVLEMIIEALSWVIAFLLFYFLIPKLKKREAFISILVMQLFTWPLGFIVAELKLISYPSRFFEYATTSSFTFEFLVFPVISALFNQYYPKRPTLLKVLTYSGLIVSVLTIAEVILELYTDNIEYIQWKWYWSWITMFILLYISNRVWNRVIAK